MWFNNRCGTARNVRKWLDENGHDYVVRDYLTDVPSADEIRDVLAKGDMRAADLFRAKEALAEELGLRGVEDEAALVDAMAAHPRLINRPVVIDGDRAKLCRPASEVEAFLS
nr:ArsC/Spx/MgsR family protein [Pacificimonas pallii]